MRFDLLKEADKTLRNLYPLPLNRLFTCHSMSKSLKLVAVIRGAAHFRVSICTRRIQVFKVSA